MAERKKWTTADEEASHRLADEEEEDWLEVYKRQCKKEEEDMTPFERKVRVVYLTLIVLIIGPLLYFELVLG